MAGFGVKVQTDTGHYLWLTELGTAKVKTAKGVIKFESETGADMYRERLANDNPHANFITAKL